MEVPPRIVNRNGGTCTLGCPLMASPSLVAPQKGRRGVLLAPCLKSTGLVSCIRAGLTSCRYHPLGSLESTEYPSAVKRRFVQVMGLRTPTSRVSAGPGRLTRPGFTSPRLPLEIRSPSSYERTNRVRSAKKRFHLGALAPRKLALAAARTCQRLHLDRTWRAFREGVGAEWLVF